MRLAFLIFLFHAIGSFAALFWLFGAAWAPGVEGDIAGAVLCALWQPLVWWLWDSGLEGLAIPLVPVNSAIAAAILAWAIGKLRRTPKPPG